MKIPPPSLDTLISVNINPKETERNRKQSVVKVISHEFAKSELEPEEVDKIIQRLQKNPEFKAAVSGG